MTTRLHILGASSLHGRAGVFLSGGGGLAFIGGSRAFLGGGRFVAGGCSLDRGGGRIWLAAAASTAGSHLEWIGDQRTLKPDAGLDLAAQPNDTHCCRPGCTVPSLQPLLAAMAVVSQAMLLQHG